MYKVIKQVLTSNNRVVIREEVMIIDCDLKQLETVYVPKFQKLADAEVVSNNLCNGDKKIRYVFALIKPLAENLIDDHIRINILANILNYNKEVDSRNAIIKRMNKSESRDLNKGLLARIEMKTFDNPFYNIDMINDYGEDSDNISVAVESRNIL